MFLGQGDSGRNEKWMDMGSRINKTWVVRTGTAHIQPASPERTLRQQRTQGQWGTAVNYRGPQVSDASKGMGGDDRCTSCHKGATTLRRGSG